MIPLKAVEGISKLNLSFDKINQSEKMEISLGIVDESIFKLENFKNKLFD